jgi:NDP-hexose-3-ketoreductase
VSLRIAVWGIGPHATKKIIPAIAASKGLQLYGVCSRNTDVVAAQAQHWRCKAWTDPAAMLADAMLDVVYVSTPIALHAEHGRRVLTAGKHLWCEKPLTSELKSTLELLESAERHVLTVCEGLMYLHHPHFRQLSNYIAGGRLGEVLSVWSRFGVPKLDYPSFRTDPALGGGALFDVGCYPVSAIHALFPEHATSVVVSRIATRNGSPVDTDGTTVLELSNGTLAHLEWRINCAYRNDITVWGTAASLMTNQIFSKPANYVPRFQLHDLRGVETTETAEPGDHFVAMLEGFVAITERVADAAAERNRIARTASTLHEISVRRS